MQQPCSGCGIMIADGAAGCQALFDKLTAREFEDYRYARFHRVIVDTYCVQHPDRYCVSAKSLMAHLGGMCCYLEHDADQRLYRALQGSLNGKLALEKPLLPLRRGPVTVMDVWQAEGVEAYAEVVGRWARSVWEAQAAVQPWARCRMAELSVKLGAGRK